MTLGPASLSLDLDFSQKLMRKGIFECAKMSGRNHFFFFLRSEDFGGRVASSSRPINPTKRAETWDANVVQNSYYQLVPKFANMSVF